MNIWKKSIIPVYIISLALLFTCFDAKRNNPFDPNSPNNPYYGHPIKIDKIGYNFGSVNVGASSERITFEVTSKVNYSVYIDRIESSYPEVFQVFNTVPGLPFTMPSDGHVDFEVEFHPNAEGQFSGTIDVIYTETNGPRISMPVAGNGLPGTINNYQFYVSQYNGNDSNPGTANAPFATITRAVEAALPGNKIAVAQGNYTNNNNDIVLAGIELYGGFPDDGMWNEDDRDPKSNYTEIADNRSFGGTSYDYPNATIIIEGNTENTTIIDGFSIMAGQYGYTCSIKIDTDNINGYSAIISNNKIDRDDIYGSTHTYGIFHLDGSSTSGDFQITIDSNSIYGGDADGAAMDAYSYGIYLERWYSGKNISINIWNNTIDGGEAVNSDTTMFARSCGIYIDNIAPNIFNNTIYAGYAYGMTEMECGIYLFDSSSPSIINNIIFGDSYDEEYGIYEGDTISDPSVVDNNDLFEINTALYYDGTNGYMQYIDSNGSFYDGTATYATPPGNDNINLEAYFADQSGGDWHLTGSSYYEVRTGGQDLSTYFTTDKDSNTRTDPWSIGAYEFD